MSYQDQQGAWVHRRIRQERLTMDSHTAMVVGGFKGQNPLGLEGTHRYPLLTIHCASTELLKSQRSLCIVPTTFGGCSEQRQVDDSHKATQLGSEPKLGRR